MAMNLERQERIANAMRAELDMRGLPKTQEECCAMAARSGALHGGIEAMPTNDDEFRGAAEGAAQGLFGPAFERADDTQRETWVCMCETALRKAYGDIARN